MKIVQISTVTEHYMKDGEFVPYEDATIYGLGDDQRMYYWGKVEKKKGLKDKIGAMLDSEEEATDAPEKDWGWQEYGKA